MQAAPVGLPSCGTVESSFIALFVFFQNRDLSYIPHHTINIFSIILQHLAATVTTLSPALLSSASEA